MVVVFDVLALVAALFVVQRYVRSRYPRGQLGPWAAAVLMSLPWGVSPIVFAATVTSLQKSWPAILIATLLLEITTLIGFRLILPRIIPTS
jgi:hypothetical protein